MTTDDIKAALERAEKATAGPWEVQRYTNYIGWGVYAANRGCIAERWYDTEQDEPYGSELNANSVFVANARTDVPRLARALLVAMEALEKVRIDEDHYYHLKRIATQALKEIAAL